MKYDPFRHHRRSIRLKGYDYSRAGAYFVTICVNHWKCLLGKIIDGKMCLSDAGMMVQETWHQLPLHYSGFDLDQFVIMPNHIHGITVIKESNAKDLSLPDVVHRFKTLTTKRYTDGVKGQGWPRFHRRFWQRNYHEHIIRDECRLKSIRKYIQYNPLKWELDRENPNYIPLSQKRQFWREFLGLRE